MAKNRDEEHKLQVAITSYLSMNKIYNFAVPNGGYRNISVAKKLKAEGVKSGVSDLIILLPNKPVFVELKTPKGRVSDTQKEFKRVVEELGFEYLLWRSIDDAIEFVKKHKQGVK